MNKLFTAAAVATGLLASPALAVTSFDLTTGGTGIGTGMATFTSGAFSLDVYAINTQNSSPAAFVTQNGDGLGVSYDGEYNGLLGDPEGEVDNIGDDEALVFDFGQLASFDSAEITAAYPGCWIFCSSDDFEVYGSNDSSVTTYTNGTIGGFIALGDLLVSDSNDTVVDLTSIASMYRYLMVTVPGGSGDGFRVASVAADISAVPLPLGVPLIASAFGVAFLIRRRAA